MNKTSLESSGNRGLQPTIKDSIETTARAEARGYGKFFCKTFFPALFILCLIAGCAKESTVETNYGPAPDFSLTESSGRTLTRSDLTDKVWIADFVFTS